MKHRPNTLLNIVFGSVFAIGTNNSAAKPVLNHYQAALQQLQSTSQLPIKNTIHLPSTCFTQGFTIDNRKLYLSCGQYGHSSLYIYALSNAPVLTAAPPQLTLLDKINLPKDIFAEGLAVTENYIYLLTWKSQKLFRFNKQQPTLDSAHIFHYPGEAWGLSYDAEKQQLLLSNGSRFIYSFNENLDKQEAIRFNAKLVIMNNENNALRRINELEVVENKLLFNRWFDNTIYFIELNAIEKGSQQTLTAGSINIEMLSKLHPKNDVLNGIAYNRHDKSIWITGKNWGIAYQLSAKYFFQKRLIDREERPVSFIGDQPSLTN